MNEQVRNDCCENNCNNWSSWNNNCGCQNTCNSCCNSCGSTFTGGSSWSWIWWIIILVAFLYLISAFTGNGCF
ncbi:MAG: hypothetical protein IJC12_00070 [Peptococcaceae bacterium]|nr:hypothetical protein [Peptococcaceae bacterium]